jgi:hypothetical protein
MIKPIEEILVRVGESAKLVGLSFDDLFSLIVLAKFTTELPNEELGNALKGFLTKVSRSVELVELANSVGVDPLGKTIFEVLDEVSDVYRKGGGAIKLKIESWFHNTDQVLILVNCFNSDFGK